MLNTVAIPKLLRNIPKPPEQLHGRGQSLDLLLDKPRVAIVGSRKVSAYGREVTCRFAEELARRGIVIISGLALGIDALAHKAALDAGGITIAVLPCGIETVYPATNRQLAERILSSGGALLSEYGGSERAYKVSFLERNRLIAGLADVVIITEAAERSGSLNTARHAREQGKPVYAVPGNISSPLSAGTNMLIRRGQATALTDSGQILELLALPEGTEAIKVHGDTAEEEQILTLLYAGITDGGELLRQSQLAAPIFNSNLTMLELKGHVRSLGNNQWAIL